MGGIAAVVTGAMLPDDVMLPQIKISPQEIFTNQIAMLDVNFVNPHDTSDFQLISEDKDRKCAKYYSTRLKRSDF